ncbi:MAG: adenylate kinase [Pirellula sp.]|nr:adenylate kinase [Pirellula sp.]
MMVVFIGPPGAGKGTQCRRLVDLLRIPHLSTGEMLRAVMREESALSRWLASYIDAGKLAPDHLVMRIVAQKLQSDECKPGALFDGFPRTIVQAQLLDDYLMEHHRPLDVALNLQVDEEILVERLLKRAQIDGRADDNYETIRERLKVFRTQTSPLIDYYSKQGKLESIDGAQSEDQVFEDIQSIVMRLQQRA